MSRRTVVSLLMDFFESTAASLAMSEGRFRRFNKAVVDGIEPYLQRYELEDSIIKHGGDGWLITNANLEKTAALVHRRVQTIHSAGAPVWLEPRSAGAQRPGRVNLLSAPVH